MLRVSHLVLGIVLLAAPVAVLPAAGPTADEVVSRAEQQFAGLTDYECLSEMEAHQGERQESGRYHLWFKKPRMLRVRVTGGRNRGSEVAIDSGGAIRGRKGGLLKPFVMRLKPTDRRLKSIRGVPVTEFYWGAFYEKLRRRASLAGAQLSLEPHLRPEAPFEVVLTYRDAGKSMREVYGIDPRLWVMVEGEVFEDGTRVDHVTFQDIRLNTGVAESWFRL
jgi:outer membrane lipoprotein-sorting protein